MKSLLEDAASRLPLSQGDVDALVEASLVRGRRRRRRRTALLGVGSLAAVTALGMGVVAVDRWVGPSAPVVVSPADSAPSEPRYTPLASDQEIEDRVRAALPKGLVVDRLTVERTPGRLVLPGEEQVGPNGLRISFFVGGAEVGIAVDWPSARRVAMGLPSLPPDEECRGSDPMPAGCRALPDGSWIETVDERPEGGDAPADEVENYVAYWRTDGWRLYASAFNSTTEKGDGVVVARHPPLTTAQLRELATSDLWFAQATEPLK